MSGCRCHYGGIAAARRFLTAVQRFSAIVSMSRAFERRLEVGASWQKLRRTSLECRYLFSRVTVLPVASSSFVRNTVHDFNILGCRHRYIYRL